MNKSRLSDFLQFVALLFDSTDYTKMPYREYLYTKHWKVTREAKLHAVSHRCQVCNSPKSLNVHHRTYERLGREKLEDLTVLCKECHELFHEHRKLVKP